MTISCIAVDDEPAALNLIAGYIGQTPFLKLEGKFSNAIEALKFIYENKDIQLIFLDIRMADLNGVELARIIEQSDRKKSLRIIFTTAYDHYALESYKVEALDYLLKPFNFVDFSKAATKAYAYFELFNTNKEAPVAPAITEPALQFLYVKSEHQFVKIDVSDILYIEGMKDYAKIFLKNTEKPILTLMSLKKLQEKLPEDKFLRIHRSYIVNTAEVKTATKTSIIIGGTTLYVSDQFKDTFGQFLGKWFD